MDFMKLLKSLDELLYELVTWLLFYPLTLWRIIRHPHRMLAYAESELTDKEGSQFDDALSPPILLLLTLVLLHILETVADNTSAPALPGFLADNRNLIVFRAAALSLFPLLFAITRLKVKKSRLARSSLKPAFYSQSYAAVPLILGCSIGVQVAMHDTPLLIGIGTATATLAVTWYVAVQTVWSQRDTRLSSVQASLVVLATLFLALVALVLVASVVSLAAGGLG